MTTLLLSVVASVALADETSATAAREAAESGCIDLAECAGEYVSGLQAADWQRGAAMTIRGYCVGLGATAAQLSDGDGIIENGDEAYGHAEDANDLFVPLKEAADAAFTAGDIHFANSDWADAEDDYDVAIGKVEDATLQQTSPGPAMCSFMSVAEEEYSSAEAEFDDVYQSLLEEEP
jgi:hypothetical protein